MERNDNKESLIGKIYFNNYKIIEKLGEGSFGAIYLAISNDNEEFAMKFENRLKGQPLLQSEGMIMSYLKGPGIPFVKSYGYSGDFNILVMELLGKSLEDIFTSLPQKKMTVRCVCNLGIQMVQLLRFIHDKHIVHRDIKPDNFLMGRKEKRKKLYILDFGLARKYRSSQSLEHYPCQNKKKLTGTARYASINALIGLEQSRRDDLEAVGYVLMYFLRGSLPWQGLPVKNIEDRYKKIMEKKRSTSPSELCQGFPRQFEEYVSYTRRLEYTEDPDYDRLTSLFESVLRDNGWGFDYYYDWEPAEGLSNRNYGNYGSAFGNYGNNMNYFKQDEGDDDDKKVFTNTRKGDEFDKRNFVDNVDNDDYENNKYGNRDMDICLKKKYTRSNINDSEVSPKGGDRDKRSSNSGEKNFDFMEEGNKLGNNYNYNHKYDIVNNNKYQLQNDKVNNDYLNKRHNSKKLSNRNINENNNKPISSGQIDIELKDRTNKEDYEGDNNDTNKNNKKNKVKDKDENKCCIIY